MKTAIHSAIKLQKKGVEKNGKYEYMHIPIIHKMAIRRNGKRRKKEYNA